MVSGRRIPPPLVQISATVDILWGVQGPRDPSKNHASAQKLARGNSDVFDTFCCQYSTEGIMDLYRVWMFKQYMYIS